MRLYEQLAEEIVQAIASGVLRPGDALPSVRAACASRRVSADTVFKAYYLLEARGLVEARPRAGYFVKGQAAAPAEPAVSRPRAGARHLDVHDLVTELLATLKTRDILPLGSPFIGPDLMPLDRLRRALVRATRLHDPWSTLDDMPPGHEPLRRQILRRYLERGVPVAADEVVVTHGCIQALNLCVQAVTRPGGAVVIECPCFYVQLQALHTLGLKAVEVATEPREGIDLSRLAAALERWRPQACWLMTNFQNPLGATMPDDKKRELVALLARHEVPLIEDDVYHELHHGPVPPASAKTFDRKGLVMHCCSFSKSLAPGYRVGWTAAGRFAPQVQRLKLMTTLSGSVPAQAAVHEYLGEGGYEAHLRRLRATLARQRDLLLHAVGRHFPAGTRASRPAGGYVCWVELPARVDALRLHRLALERGISIAPGQMFSAHRQFGHCIRLNFGQAWSTGMEQAVATLGELAHRLDAG